GGCRERQLQQAGGDVARVDRLEAQAAGCRDDREARHGPRGREHQGWNCAARSVVHGSPEVSTASSASSLERKYPSGTRSAPITEMRTTCSTPARAAARTGFAVARSSPVRPPARWTTVPTSATAAVV